MLELAAVYEARDGQGYASFEIDHELVRIARSECTRRPPNPRRRNNAYSHSRTPKHRRRADHCRFGWCRRPQRADHPGVRETASPIASVGRLHAVTLVPPLGVLVVCEYRARDSTKRARTLVLLAPAHRNYVEHRMAPRVLVQHHPRLNGLLRDQSHGIRSARQMTHEQASDAIRRQPREVNVGPTIRLHSNRADPRRQLTHSSHHIFEDQAGRTVGISHGYILLRGPATSSLVAPERRPHRAGVVAVSTTPSAAAGSSSVRQRPSRRRVGPARADHRHRLSDRSRSRPTAKRERVHGRLEPDLRFPIRLGAAW